LLLLFFKQGQNAQQLSVFSDNPKGKLLSGGAVADMKQCTDDSALQTCIFEFISTKISTKIPEKNGDQCVC
jgi:hypothetical protein